MATLKETFSSPTTMTITLASLASSTTGVGRQSDLVDNSSNRYVSANVYVKVTVGTSPTANTPIYVYLLRSDNNGGSQLVTDGAGASDAGLTVKNAQLLGVITCTATTSDVAYIEAFDTSSFGPLGPEWGIAVVNSTGVALNSTTGNHSVTYVGVTKDIT